MADGLLLLHAFPLDHTMWEPQVREFQSSIPLVAPDFPGFGAASSSPFPPTIDGAADAAAEALTRAGVENAVVCGLSMGGYVAMAFWRRHSARVLGLVFANTRGDADDEAGRERRHALARRLRQEGNFLASEPPPLLSGDAPGDLVALVKNIISSQPAAAIAAASEAMAARPDSIDELRRVAVKSLVISADHDTLIPPEVSRRIADAVPGSRFELIQHSGHLSNLEQAPAFNELLRDHLVRCGLIEEGFPARMRMGPPE